MLRKSNLIPEKGADNDHLVLRRDVHKSEEGYIMNVFSSKTLKYRKRVQRVPLVATPGSPLCGVEAISNCLQRERAQSDSPIFMYRGTPIYYADVLKYLKFLVAAIGKKPEDVGLHSLRRSGALFLQSLGVPLEEIMYMGDWSSMAVLDYLVTTFDRKISIEKMVSQHLSGE